MLRLLDSYYCTTLPCCVKLITKERRYTSQITRDFHILSPILCIVPHVSCLVAVTSGEDVEQLRKVPVTYQQQLKASYFKSLMHARTSQFLCFASTTDSTFVQDRRLYINMYIVAISTVFIGYYQFELHGYTFRSESQSIKISVAISFYG